MTANATSSLPKYLPGKLLDYVTTRIKPGRVGNGELRNPSQAALFGNIFCGDVSDTQWGWFTCTDYIDSIQIARYLPWLLRPDVNDFTEAQHAAEVCLRW
jgi:hypothetical protein